jgi:hypothetical protein
LTQKKKESAIYSTTIGNSWQTYALKVLAGANSEEPAGKLAPERAMSMHICVIIYKAKRKLTIVLISWGYKETIYTACSRINLELRIVSAGNISDVAASLPSSNNLEPQQYACIKLSFRPPRLR